jgi:pilus assembly protein Flp/PilA
MKSLLEKISRFLKADDGPTAVEYAVMLMLILLVCLSAITLIGDHASTSFESSSDSIDAAMN